MKWIKAYKGFLLSVFTIILFQIFRLFPDFLELLYVNGVYKAIRYIYSLTLTHIPFPLLYIFILVVLWLLIRWFFKKKKKHWFPTLINFSGWIIVCFYWFWGFNYSRSEFNERANIDIHQPNEQLLYQELLYVDSILQLTRHSFSSNESIPLTKSYLPINYQEQIRLSQTKVLKSFNEPVFSDPKVRELRPEGSLLRLKTAGVYLPFVFEGHIDAGLHPIEKPYVMAHEMAHAYGLTDEGVCNFIGFMTCVNAEDPFIAYSGWLEYQGYLYRALRRNYPNLLKENDYKLPVVVITDITAIRERLDKYPNIAPYLRDLFYNNYLRAQGISEGMKSYSQITKLAYSYKLAHGDYKIQH